MSSLLNKPTVCIQMSRACFSRHARPIFPQEKPLKSKKVKIPWRATNGIYYPNKNFLRPIRRDDQTMAARVKYPVVLENGSQLHFRMMYHPRYV